MGIYRLHQPAVAATGWKSYEEHRAESERLLEVFEHISGMVARREDLEISLTALLVSKSTNIGLEPVVKSGETALTRGRLVGVDYGDFNLPDIRAASVLLVKAQGEIPIAREHWGGGLVASADGMRFAVPVRNLHARPNRKYFGNGAGATWLNVVSAR